MKGVEVEIVTYLGQLLVLGPFWMLLPWRKFPDISDREFSISIATILLWWFLIGLIGAWVL